MKGRKMSKTKQTKNVNSAARAGHVLIEAGSKEFQLLGAPNQEHLTARLQSR